MRALLAVLCLTLVRSEVLEDSFGFYVDPDTGTKTEVRRWTISSEEAEVQVIGYGAAISSLRVPDKSGQLQDITMGFDTIEDYVAISKTIYNPHFGAIIGRVANRVSGAKFEINGKRYNVTANVFPNQLHGGKRGFDKRVWSGEVGKSRDSVTLSYVSADGEEGYPGLVVVHVTYQLIGQSLHISMIATSTKTTPISLTNHAYFNLAGHGAGAEALYDHVASLNADKITPAIDTIPTGEFESVGGTVFDLRTPQRLGNVMPKTPEGGYDTNFCVNQGLKGDQSFVARVYHPESGRVMEVFSDQIGVQFYTSNHLPPGDQVKGKNSTSYKKHGAFCLETQNYPDAVNQHNFPSPLVHPGEVHKHTTTFRFSVQQS